MKSIFISILLSVNLAYADHASYNCVDESAAKSILVVNLANDLGHDRATVGDIEDIEATIEDCLNSPFERTNTGYILIPSAKSWCNKVIKISCSGKYEAQ